MSSNGPQPYRWTIAQYRVLGKHGILHEIKTMLLDGVIYEAPVAEPPHDCALTLANEQLRMCFRSGCHFRCQMGFDIGHNNDPTPDLAVVRGAIRDFSNRTPTTADLIV